MLDMRTMLRTVPADTGRKLNAHKIEKTFRTTSERPMYVQFVSCVYGGVEERIGNMDWSRSVKMSRNTD